METLSYKWKPLVDYSKSQLIEIIYELIERDTVKTKMIMQELELVHYELCALQNKKWF